MKENKNIGLEGFLRDKKNIKKGTILYSISELSGKKMDALMYAIGISVGILIISYYMSSMFYLLLLLIPWLIAIWYKKTKQKKIDKYCELVINNQKFKQLCQEYTYNELKRKELDGILEKELKENPYFKKLLENLGMGDLSVESATDAQVQDARKAFKEASTVVLSYFPKRDLLEIKNGEWICPFCNSKQKEDYRECLKCHWVVEDFF